MNKLIVALITMLMLLPGVVLAAERSTIAFEVGSLNIKLSNDRTGIVKDVICKKCDFSIVKITAETRAYVNGKQVDLLRAKSRSRKMATVIFYPDTREVKKITWLE